MKNDFLAKSELKTKDIEKFHNGITSENTLFWSRFDKEPYLKGAKILEVGSGWGSLSIEMALAGARKVVGLDIKSDLISFANKNLKANFPHLVNIVEFYDIELKEFSENNFNYIISKDSFEHIQNLERMLIEMRKRLEISGRIYTGFGPLYKSPYGDHDRRITAFRHLKILGELLAKIPWGHLFMESSIIKMQNRYLGKNIKSMNELGFNKITLSDFIRMIKRAGLNITYLGINQSQSILSPIFSLIRKIDFLEDYFTHNIYCILEN